MARLGLDPVRAWQRTRSAIRTALLSALPAMRRAGAAVLGDAKVLRAAQQAAAGASSGEGAVRSIIGETEWERISRMRQRRQPVHSQSSQRGTGDLSEVTTLSNDDLERALLPVMSAGRAGQVVNGSRLDEVLDLASEGRGDIDRLSPSSTFELLRFDFVYDRSGTPWLLEVNMSPNLHPHRTKGKHAGSDGAMKRGAIRAALAMASSSHWIPKDILALLESWNAPDTHQPEQAREFDRLMHARLQRRAGTGRTDVDLCPMSAARLMQMVSVHRRRGDMELVWPPEGGDIALSAAHVAFGLGTAGERPGRWHGIQVPTSISTRLEGPVAKGRRRGRDDLWDGQELAWERRAARAFAVLAAAEHQLSAAALLVGRRIRLSEQRAAETELDDMAEKLAVPEVSDSLLEATSINAGGSAPMSSSGLERACLDAGGTFVRDLPRRCDSVRHLHRLAAYLASWEQLLEQDRPLVLSAEGALSRAGRRAASALQGSAALSSGVWDVPAWHGWKRAV